jgi:hypothetical protein
MSVARSLAQQRQRCKRPLLRMECSRHEDTISCSSSTRTDRLAWADGFDSVHDCLHSRLVASHGERPTIRVALRRTIQDVRTTGVSAETLRHTNARECSPAVRRNAGPAIPPDDDRTGAAHPARTRGGVFACGLETSPRPAQQGHCTAQDCSRTPSWSRWRNLGLRVSSWLPPRCRFRDSRPLTR